MADLNKILTAQITLQKRGGNDGAIMRWLKKNGPATYLVLSYELAISYDTTVKLVNRMKTDGLVEVEKIPGPHLATVRMVTKNA